MISQAPSFQSGLCRTPRRWEYLRPETHQPSSPTLTLFPGVPYVCCLFLFPSLFLTSCSLHQKSTSSASSEASETCQSVSECNSPTAVSTACVSSLYRTHTHSQTRTHRRTGCCTIHLLYSVVGRGPWVVLDSRSAGWCGLVMDVEHSDSDLSVRSAVWLMLILRYLSPCFLSHWLHHQASLCHTSCVPHI